MRVPLFILGLLLATPAVAADPVGIWALDREAWSATVDRLVPKLIGRIPEAQRAAMAAQGLDLESQIRANFTTGIEGTLELRRGGRVVARNRHDVADSAGLWSADGDNIEIELPEERLTLQGPLTDTRMKLRPRLDHATQGTRNEDSLWLAAVGEMVFVLVRQP